MFSQISDSNGHLMVWRFDEYLKEVLALPAAVYESPSFSYSPDLGNTIFNTVCNIYPIFPRSKINRLYTIYRDSNCSLYVLPTLFRGERYNAL